jgi:hypothetical protein
MNGGGLGEWKDGRYYLVEGGCTSYLLLHDGALTQVPLRRGMLTGLARKFTLVNWTSKQVFSHPTLDPFRILLTLATSRDRHVTTPALQVLTDCTHSASSGLYSCANGQDEKAALDQ